MRAAYAVETAALALAVTEFRTAGVWWTAAGLAAGPTRRSDSEQERPGKEVDGCRGSRVGQEEGCQRQAGGAGGQGC